MKPFHMFLSVLALVIGLGSAADAGLLSLYTFDNTADNSVSGAPNGTLVGGASYVAGMVGNAISLDGTDDHVNLGTSGIPTGDQIKSGSTSFWSKTAASSGFIFAAFNEGVNTAFCVSQFSASQMRIYLRDDANRQEILYATTNNTDGNWHQVVLAWDVATSTTYSMAAYVDGVAVVTSRGPGINDATMSHDSVLSAWEYPMRIGAGVRETASNFFAGSLDDLGVWSNRLTATEASACYNLAMDSVLNYGTEDADTLFDVFASGSGASGQTSDGETWVYATGLTGVAGTVYDHSALVLDDFGGGVQLVPEPAAGIMLAAGLIGLLCYAWRKRR